MGILRRTATPSSARTPTCARRREDPFLRGPHHDATHLLSGRRSGDAAHASGDRGCPRPRACDLPRLRRLSRARPHLGRHDAVGYRRYPEPGTDRSGRCVHPDAIFQTGDYLFVGRNGTRNGFVRCNARSIGSATSGATERANPDCETSSATIWNNYANAQAAVSGGRGVHRQRRTGLRTRPSPPGSSRRRDDRLRHDGQFGGGAIGFRTGRFRSAPLRLILAANTHTLSSTDVPAHTHSFRPRTGQRRRAYAHGDNEQRRRACAYDVYH